MTLVSNGPGNFVPYKYTYANAAARTGATGFVAADIGAWAVQLDDGSVWELTATTPTWAQRGGGSTPATLAFASYTRTSGDYTTTEATNFIDVDATNLALTITTGARRVQIGLVADAYHSVANAGVALDVAIDGTRQGGTLGLIFPRSFTAGNSTPATFVYETPSALSAASHTFKLQWKGSAAGTSTLFGTTTLPLVFWVQEVA